MTEPRRLLVTSALPYANGPIHIGHLLEYIQTDVWVRILRMRGHEVFYVGADDAHGTPIMLRAEREGITPETLIARVRLEHERDFFGGQSALAAGELAGFMIGFDHYHSTHSDENLYYATTLYERLKAAGMITTRTIEQLYDPERGMFLPDRFVKGNCPRCGAADQYGDACEKCGATYRPTELIEPYSAVSGARPELRESEHHFFRLSACEGFLRDWLARPGVLQEESRNKLMEWLDSGLQDWDISRDAPYFGFAIPGAPEKFFYVWMDAPIGYLGAFASLAAAGGNVDLDSFLDAGVVAAEAQSGARPATEMVHFIGKDILYFHALFWPAMLEHAGFRTPTAVNVHGFVTVNGAKMSKSRGTFITAESYLACGLDPEQLRYYYCAKLNASAEDIDLSLDDFAQRVNADLVGKFVNIASRAAGFLSRGFAGRLRLHEGMDMPAFADPAARVALADKVGALFEAREYSQAVREVMRVADEVNEYFDARKPWVLAKDETRQAELQHVCSASLAGFHLLAIWLAPILPKLGRRVARELFALDRDFLWGDCGVMPERVAPYQHLMQRLERARLDTLVEANRQNLEASPPVAVHAPAPTASPADGGAATGNVQGQGGPAAASGGEGSGAGSASKGSVAAFGRADAPAPTVGEAEAFASIEQFGAIDLRIARVLAADPVEGADKLLRLTLDVGEIGQKNVFAGIKAAYPAGSLVGRLVLMVANLKPRKMRFGLSEGMVLAASDERGGPFLLAPDAGAEPGMRVK
jgi:methionyl-tRNA synthetase